MASLNQSDIEKLLSETSTGNSPFEEMFLGSAYSGNISQISMMLDGGSSIDTIHHATGMSALHIAVGRNNLELTKLLVERGASFFADKQGRWPSSIAALCEVSEELCDYVAESEAKAEGGTEAFKRSP